MNTTICWSCGGGIQSVAIGVLFKEGVLPKPDFAGIADTGRECQSTWDYLDGVLNPYLRDTGVQWNVFRVLFPGLICTTNQD